MRRSPTQTKVSSKVLNCASEMSLSRNATGREFQRHGPATEKHHTDTVYHINDRNQLFLLENVKSMVDFGFASTVISLLGTICKKN